MARFSKSSELKKKKWLKRVLSACKNILNSTPHNSAYVKNIDCKIKLI